MNRFTLIAVMVLLTGFGSQVSAQTTSTASVQHPHPRIHEVHTRMREQLMRIQEGVKSGKLTKEQAQALKAELKAVQVQIKADFTTNGNRSLTEEQYAQLNQMLNENSKAIYGEKHDTTDASGSDTSSTAGASGSSSTDASSTGSSPAGTGNSAPSNP